MIPTIRVPKGQELIVMGDVHENEWHFEQMLDRAEVGTKRILISLGDIYDKGDGPHVAERIVRKIRELQEAGWAYIVRGNHEQRNIKRILRNDEILTPELEWCKNLPLLLSFIFTNQNRITIVHAGVTPHHTWGNVVNNTEVMYIRTLDKNNRPIPLIWVEENGVKKLRAEKKGVVWHEKYDGRFGYILSGHDSQRDGVVKFYKHSCNLDTRCYDTGVLAGQIIAEGMLKELILIRK
jgi:predicted phosphodiesterase